jgi:ankyrin repeat protein
MGSNLPPMHKAVADGDIEAIARLVNQGEDIDVIDEDGQTPLYRAVWKNSKQLVSVLLDNGANYRWRDSKGRTSVGHNISRYISGHF